MISLRPMMNGPLGKDFITAILLFLCCVVTAPCPPLIAQQYNIEVTSYTWEDGLPHRQINATAEDADGFLWIASRAGVSRFDGYEFKNWSKLSDGLISNEIGRVAVDSKGYVWAIAMPSYQFHVIGINLIDRISGEVLSFEEVYDFEWPVPTDQLSGFHFDPASGIFYFGVREDCGILSFHPDRGFEFRKLPLEVDIQSLLGITSDGTWWVSTRNNVCVGITVNDEVKQIPRDLNSAIAVTNAYLPGEVGWIGRGQNGTSFIWAGPGLELNYLPTPTEKHRIAAALVGLADVKSEVDPEEKVTYFKEHTSPLLDRLFEEESIVGAYYIKHILVEKEASVWLSTDNGLLRVEWNRPVFRRWPAGFTTFTSSVRDIMMYRDSQLLVSLEESGIYVLNPYSLEHELVYAADDDKLMVALAPLTDGFLFSEGPLINEGKVGQPKRQVGNVNAKIWDIFPGYGGYYLVATESGLSLYDPIEKQSSDFSQYNGFDELKTVQSNFVTRSSNGHIWICATTGLYRIDPLQGVMERFWTGGEGRYHLPDNNIYHLFEDETGLFWIATGGGGLICWHPEQGLQRQFTRADGLGADFIYATYLDEQNKLWLPTDFGLTLMNRENLEVLRTFLPKDGLSYHEFNRCSYLQLEDGTLCFGTLAGLNIFHPTDVYNLSAATSPRMKLTGYTQFDADQGALVNRLPDYVRDGEITLQPNDRFARLEFALLTFEKQVRVRYAYRLEPSETDWTYQEERALRLGQLPYGDHTLVIRGQAPDGEWSPHQLEIPIHVVRPFYWQWWFLLGSVLVVSAGVVLFFRYRTWRYRIAAEELQTAVEDQTRKIRVQTEELKQLDRLKSRLFANVSHELRTPLTMILGPISSMLKKNKLSSNQRQLLQHAQQNGKDLLRLINNILDLAKMDAAKLEVKEEAIDFYPFVKTLVANFESYANRLKIFLVFDYRLPQDLILYLDAEKVATILRNYLSNALKYTASGGQVVVSCTMEDGQVALAVKDNGDGIAAEDLPYIFDRFFQSKQAEKATSGGTGIGLALCRELAKAIDGKVWAESELGEGSSFFLRFPRKDVLGVVAETKENSEYLAGPVLMESPIQSTANNNSTKQRILVVEDSLSIQHYLQMLLSPTYELAVANNGEEALQLLGRLPDGNPKPVAEDAFEPDLILSDVMMPRMSGLEMTRIIKGQAELAPIPLILLTALADQEEKVNSLRIGVDDYLLKPFDEEELQVRIANALENHAQRRAAVKEADAGPETIDDKPAISEEDQEFLRQLEKYAEELISSPNLNLDYLCENLYLSRRQLQRRIRSLTGLAPNAYLKETRLVKARSLLENRTTSSVKATALAVGMKDVDYFSKIFRERFGKLPSSYL